MSSLDLFLKYQAVFNEDLSPVKFGEKSRRIGLTWAEAANSVILASRSGRQGSDTWYLAANEDGAKEFMIDCSEWAKSLNKVCSDVSEIMLRDENKDIQAYQIRFASGWRVTGLTSRPTNLRGKQGRVVADEFAFHPDPEGLEKAAMALLMWGGQVIFISTHNGVNSYFNTMIQEVRAGKRKGSIHRITLDDAIRDGLYQRICLVTGVRWTMEGEEDWRAEIISNYGDNADEELFCIPKASGSSYFSLQVVQARMTPLYEVKRLALPDSFLEQSDSERRNFIAEWLDTHIRPILGEIPDYYNCYAGMDFARINHVSVITVMVRKLNLVSYVPLMIELRNVPIREQKQILWYVIDTLPRFCSAMMDANGNGLAIAEASRERYGQSRIYYMNASEAKYKELFPRYKGALEDRLLEAIPADADTLSDHGCIKLIDGVPKIPKGGQYRGTDNQWRHGDAAMSLAFAYWAMTEYPMIAIGTPVQTNTPIGICTREDARKIFAASQLVPLMSRSDARKIWA